MISENLITEAILLEDDTVLLFSDSIDELYDDIKKAYEDETIPPHYGYERGMTKYKFLGAEYQVIYLWFDREGWAAKEALAYFKELLKEN